MCRARRALGASLSRWRDDAGARRGPRTPLAAEFPALRTPSSKVRLLGDAVVVLGLWAGIMFLSGAETYTFLHTPDSEFYASLSAYGSQITDRAPEDAYYWTKLGLIVPQYLLSQFLGFETAHALFRAWLILCTVASAYAVGRSSGSRSVGALGALFVGLNSVLLGFFGDTYVTGAGIASLAVLFALLFHAPRGGSGKRLLWFGVGLDFGWMLMLHPNVVVIAAPAAVVLAVGGQLVMTTRGLRPLVARVAWAILGLLVALLVHILAGAVIFPGLNWVDTVVTWSLKIDGSDYAAPSWAWLATETSLLVPVTCAVVSLGIWLASRRPEVGLFAVAGLVPMATAIAFTLATGGAFLEASIFNALLWPWALLGLVAVLLGHPSLNPLQGCTCSRSLYRALYGRFPVTGRVPCPCRSLWLLPARLLWCLCSSHHLPFVGTGGRSPTTSGWACPCVFSAAPFSCSRTGGRSIVPG